MNLIARKPLLSPYRKFRNLRERFDRRPPICKDEKSALFNLRRSSRAKSLKLADNSQVRKRTLLTSRKNSKRKELLWRMIRNDCRKR